MLLEETLKTIVPVQRSMEAEVQERLDQLTKPQGSLGRLEELALRVACIQGKNPPLLGRKLICIFAADHGIVDEGVSAYPREVTAQMTNNFLRGGAAINVLARHFAVDVEVVDVGVDHELSGLRSLNSLKIRKGTANFARAPAMSREEARQAVETGIRLAQRSASKDLFLLGVGDMGIGNTSSAAAICSSLMGVAVREITGRGTGIDEATWELKVATIEKGLSLNQPDPKDPMDVLSKVGGLEIGAMTGFILGAAANHTPLILDGYISTASALLASRMAPTVNQFLFASHLSAEIGHQKMLEGLQLSPLLNLAMRLGEGTGACIAMGLTEAAVKIAREMATFEDAGVGKKMR